MAVAKKKVKPVGGKIGLLCGREHSFPPAFLDRVNTLGAPHGITTGRGVPFGSSDWSLKEKERSAKNAITAPRMWSYEVPGDWSYASSFQTPEEAREYVRKLKAKGVDGLKLTAYRPEIMAALIDEGSVAAEAAA